MASKRSKGIKTPTSPSPSTLPNNSNNISAPISGSNSSSPHQPTLNHPLKRARATTLPSTSSESPHSAAAKTVSYSTFLYQKGCDIPKLLKAAAAFRLRNGIQPTGLRCISDFLKEVKDFVPKGLSEKSFQTKLQLLRTKFRMQPRPGPNCADVDRTFYELGLKAWGYRHSVKRNGKADGMRSKKKRAEESEDEEDEDACWETEGSMESSSDEEGERLEDGCVDMRDKNEADSPYKYLKHALEDFWIEKNLDLNVLRLALQKVDTVQAKRLDERFMEIAKDELKLKIEKNRLSDDIINVLCTGLK